ncbi:MAG: V-type ATP synthase subunit E family protein [Clostridia bacterium]|nr:V-type ATP synthase subunit E family protein [Clostridia bacterium]
MQGKDAIINKIIADAERNEKATLSDAEVRVDEIVSGLAEQSKEYIYRSKAEQDKLKEEIVARSATVAALDAKKLLLDAKNTLIVKTFETALKKARNLQKKSYEKLIFGMLELAEDGDVLIISEREKDIITAAKLKEFSEKKKIKVTLAKEFGTFDGGIILSNHGVSKNITLDTEISLLRDEMEEEIARKLFSEVK